MKLKCPACKVRFSEPTDSQIVKLVDDKLVYVCPSCSTLIRILFTPSKAAFVSFVVLPLSYVLTEWVVHRIGVIPQGYEYLTSTSLALTITGLVFFLIPKYEAVGSGKQSNIFKYYDKHSRKKSE